MKRILSLVASLSAICVLAANKPVPSGPLKVYKGPEGELIGMVEVNERKEMLVHFKNIGGAIEGQSRLYLLEDQGRDRLGVYFKKKRGSKTHFFYVLSKRNGRWTFHNPDRLGQELSLTYSEKDSEKWKIEDVLNAYKP